MKKKSFNVEYFNSWNIPLNLYKVRLKSLEFILGYTLTNNFLDRTAKQNVEYFIGLDNMKMDMTLVPEIQNGDKWK